MNAFEEKEALLQSLREDLDENGNLEAFTAGLQELTLTYQDEVWRLGVAGEWEKKTRDGWVIAAPPVNTTAGEEMGKPPIDDAPVKPEPTTPETLPVSETNDLDKTKPSGTPPPGESFTPPPETNTSSTVAPPRNGGSGKEPKGEANSQPVWRNPIIIGGGIVVLFLLCATLAAMMGSLFKPDKPISTATTQLKATPTHVSAAVASPTPTATSVPPTATTTSASPSTDTPAPKATDAPVLPTHTLLPTSTPTASATDTPTPSAIPTTAHLTATNTSTPANTPTATASSTITPLPNITGIIAYPLFDSEEETYNIHIVDLATKTEIRLIPNASQPDISVDGKKIVYRNWDASHRGLYVENLHDGGGGWDASLMHEASRPIWNVNDDIVFAVNNLSPEQWDISFAQDRRGVSNGRTPAWFNDGRLVYQGSVGVKVGLAMTDPNNGNAAFLTDYGGDIAPAPSPDGAKIAFMSDKNGDWDVYLMRLSDRTVVNLTQDSALDTSPVWSPDGKRIAFVSTRSGKWAIWSITPAGEDAQILFDLPGSFDGKVKDIPEHQQTGWQLEHISWTK